jgi:hypothetical protein
MIFYIIGLAVTALGASFLFERHPDEQQRKLDFEGHQNSHDQNQERERAAAG